MKRRVAAISPPSHAQRVKRVIRRVDTFARRLCALEDTTRSTDGPLDRFTLTFVADNPAIFFPAFLLKCIAVVNVYNDPLIANKFLFQIFHMIVDCVSKFHFVTSCLADFEIIDHSINNSIIITFV